MVACTEDSDRKSELSEVAHLKTKVPHESPTLTPTARRPPSYGTGCAHSDETASRLCFPRPHRFVLGHIGHGDQNAVGHGRDALTSSAALSEFRFREAVRAVGRGLRSQGVANANTLVEHNLVLA